jgi:hypothetical protein
MPVGSSSQMGQGQGKRPIGERCGRSRPAFRVRTGGYSKVRLSLDYWPDASDEEARLTIKKLEND